MIKQRPIDPDSEYLISEDNEVIRRILLGRGLSNQSDMDQRLAGMESPDSLAQLTEATDILEHALREQKRVLICGDYDADGATSTALLHRVLTELGLEQLDFLVPNRFDYGYGLSPELVHASADYGPQLIITVDNGISSIEGIALARSMGIDVLVTDHHLPGTRLPEANAILNPNQPGCAFPAKSLAGVGVVFYLLIGLRAALRSSNWFESRQMKEPRLERYLDLVALGTVADLVPLGRLNRILVARGLSLIRSGGGNPGIRQLFAVSGKETIHARASDLGFAIGSRLNAAGRLDDMSLGIQCLLAEDEQTALEHAQELHQINRERRQIQDQMNREAEAALNEVEVDPRHSAWSYCAYQPDWHEGLVGLVASRLKEKLYRPVVAFARSKTGELKGSARSVTGCHIRDCLALVASLNPDLIIKFGGHAMAAGLSIREKDYDLFCEQFDAAVRTLVDEDALHSITWTDGTLSDDELHLEFARTLEALLPWGQGIPEPQFTGIFEIVALQQLSGPHLKMRLVQEGSAQVLDAVWFNVPGDQGVNEGDDIRAVYTLSVNRFRNSESLQLHIVDVVP